VHGIEGSGSEVPINHISCILQPGDDEKRAPACVTPPQKRLQQAVYSLYALFSSKAVAATWPWRHVHVNRD